MAKDPAFLFYPGDWLGGTLGMSFEEKGAYLELLMLQFNRGHMTSHMIGQTVGQLWETIKGKFELDSDGLYFNRRLDEEKEKRQNYTKSRNNNRFGKNQHQNNDINTLGHMTPHMENENEDVNKDEGLNNTGENLKKIPTLEVFIKYGVDNDPTINIHSLTLKYEAWKVAGWKAGKKLNPILNWKNTLLNTLQYLQHDTQPTISKNEQRFNKFQESSDESTRILLEKYGKQDS